MNANSLAQHLHGTNLVRQWSQSLYKKSATIQDSITLMLRSSSTRDAQYSKRGGHMNTESFDIAASLELELEPLWRFGLRLTSNSDDAAELVQKTCLRALEQQHTYTNQGKFRSWLFQIQHRVWLNEIRSRKVRAHEYFDTTQSTVETDYGYNITVETASIDDSADQQVCLHQVFKAIDQLPESQRTALILVNIEGYSYKEAAAILEVPIGTIMSRLARARIAIGKMHLDNYSDIPTTSTLNVSRNSV
jgi:RNA polymerase sigma-70 factor (ECF subfamily)